jgi:Asp/Glu/hydantoin racemase
MLVACSLGRRFGLVSLEDSQRAQHLELASAYGLSDRLAAVVAMNPPIDEYMLEADDHATQPHVEAFARASADLVQAGAEVIIPGDGFLNELVWRRGITEMHGAIVLDSLGVLFRHAGFMAGLRQTMGIEVSRAGHYAKAPAAMLEQARQAADTRPMQEDEFSGRR